MRFKWVGTARRPGKPSGLTQVRSQDERTDDAGAFFALEKEEMPRAAACIRVKLSSCSCSSFSVTARHGFLLSCLLIVVVVVVRRRIMREVVR